jgi:deoxyadenosine/deoxycytidine kinase
MKISIEGNIGSGKSTLISRLCKEKRIPVFLEPVDEWKEWLTLFYTDPTRWGLSFNLHVLLTFNRWKDNAFFAIYERSPLSNRYVFTELGHDEGRLNNLELELFDTMYQKLAWEPDVVIYIRTDPQTSMERMQARARECESCVPLDYLKAIHNKHEKLFCTENTSVEASRSNKKIIVINGNQSADCVYEDVVKALTPFMQHK